MQGKTTPSHFANDIHQVVQRISLDVVFGLRPISHQLSQIEDVVSADVALFGTRVHGDATRAGLQGQSSGTGDAGNVKRALVAQQRHLVQVDRELGMPAMRIEAGGEQGIHGGRESDQGLPATGADPCF